MEDSFRVRVDKTFNSLSESQSLTSSSSSSLWSLTDDEIQKTSWNREPHFSFADVDAHQSNETDDDDDDCPFPSDVTRLLSAIKSNLSPNDDTSNPNPNPNPRVLIQDMDNDLHDLDDDDDAGECASGSSSSTSLVRERVNNEDDDDDSDVRNSIGMDSTLDFEEEEDEFDKVAVGEEIKSDDRLYMSDVTDYTPASYSNGEIPCSFEEVSRDPRANHLAAKLRLKEDADTARSFNLLQVSEPNETVATDSQSNISEDGNNLKSILKRKEDQMGSKSDKRVRFEPSCKYSDDNESKGEKDLAPEPYSNGEIILHEGTHSKNRNPSLVPDYIRNPSRYTHYTFDSSTDTNEESNRHAYMDFLNMIKKSKQSDPEEDPADLSKPMIFNPKKKASKDLMASTSNETELTKEMSMEEPPSRKNLPVSFTFETKEDEACEMEVDEQVTGVTKVSTGQRTARQYRSKLVLESSESDT